jgi:hypothetical protein
MIKNSTEAKVAAAKVKLIYKVARIAFFEATDIRACIEALEASNQADVLRSLENANAARAAGFIQKALFGRLLIGVMTAFDPCEGEVTFISGTAWTSSRKKFLEP